MVYTILKNQLYKLEEKLYKFNKKFEKYGEGEITYKVGEPYIINDMTSPLFRRKVVDVDIDGKYQIKDYEFVAKLEYNDEANKNIVKGMVDTIPVKYLTRCECDHCKSDRYRKHTILLRKDNEYVQVGSGCVKDYIGVDITHYASYLSCISEIKDIIDDYNMEMIRGNGCPIYYETREILEQTFAYVKEYGYVSKKTQEENGTKSTSEIVRDMFRGLSYQGELLYPKYNITNSIKEEVDKVVEFVKELSDNNVYNYNLKTLVLETEYIEEKEIGLVVSAIGTYLRETNIKKENQSKSLSQYVGNIGDKIEITSNVTVVTSYNTNYSYSTTTTYIYKFEYNNNIFIWKTDKYLNVNKIYKIIGKVKEYNEFKGVKQTILTRCKTEEIKQSEEIIEGNSWEQTQEIINKIFWKYN